MKDSKFLIGYEHDVQTGGRKCAMDAVLSPTPASIEDTAPGTRQRFTMPKLLLVVGIGLVVVLAGVFGLLNFMKGEKHPSMTPMFSAFSVIDEKQSSEKHTASLQGSSVSGATFKTEPAATAFGFARKFAGTALHPLALKMQAHPRIFVGLALGVAALLVAVIVTLALVLGQSPLQDAEVPQIQPKNVDPSTDPPSLDVDDFDVTEQELFLPVVITISGVILIVGGLLIFRKIFGNPCSQVKGGAGSVDDPELPRDLDLIKSLIENLGNQILSERLELEEKDLVSFFISHMIELIEPNDSFNLMMGFLLPLYEAGDPLDNDTKRKADRERHVDLMSSTGETFDSLLSMWLSTSHFYSDFQHNPSNWFKDSCEPSDICAAIFHIHSSSLTDTQLVKILKHFEGDRVLNTAASIMTHPSRSDLIRCLRKLQNEM